MTKYVFSFRVPSDYAPNAGTPAEWQVWFGGLGHRARSRRRAEASCYAPGALRS
jgi:hypothetical protein